MSLWLLAALLQPTDDVIIINGRGLPDEPPGQHRIVLDRKDLERSASGRMEDVVRSVAGLTSFRRSDARSSHPTAQGLTARGLGGNAASRFAVEVDGVPQADPFGGWINFVALDPALVDRLILTRGGNGGVTMGSGAVAGGLNIDSMAAADGRLRGGIAIGSRDSVDADARLGVAVGASTLLGGLAFQGGDGFAPIVEADRGPVDRRAPYRQANGRLRVLAPLGTAELQTSIAAYYDRRDRGVDFTDNRGQGVDASIRLVAKDWSLLAYGQQRRFESGFASVAAGRASVSPALDQHKVPASGWGAKAMWKPHIGAIAATLGADVRWTGGGTNERYLFAAGLPTRERQARAESLTSGLFGDASWSHGGTTLGAGARIDRWAISNASLFERNVGGSTITDAAYADRTGRQWSLRAGVDQRLSPILSLRASAYRAWRLPTINELVRPFRVGPDATAANAALEPERLIGVEGGADWRPSDDVRLSLTAFANRLRGAIANVTLAKGPGVFPGVGFVAANGLYRRRENLGAIASRGIELDGEWTRGRWSLGGSAALTNARIRDDGLAAFLDGERPAQVPSIQASAQAGWSDGGRLAFVTLRYSGKQDEGEGDPEPLPAAWTLDAVARWPITGRLSLDLRAENLFDRRVLTSVLADGTRERTQPRTLWIGLRID
ncbi:MAG: TonB-dependent receptor [Sphingomicrobium sp.]